MTTYKDAGVDIAAGNRAVELMKNAVRATYTPSVLAGIGAFGGLFDASILKTMTQPVLVASTDGVGTKVKVAAQLDRYDTIGADLVNHCINDILVQGARPLFFMDYIASSKLVPEQVAAVVTGLAEACSASGCALLGGETAEMPGVYAPGEFDVVGTIVGVVERTAIVDGHSVQPGDVVIGLVSTGLHTNGYSLARRVLADLDWTQPHVELGSRAVGDALLAVHRNYLPMIEKLWVENVHIKSMSHITGGGLVENMPRSLPDAVSVELDTASWKCPPIFSLIERLGNVPRDDMFHAFNMGIGFTLVVAPTFAELALTTLGADAYQIGKIVRRSDSRLRVSLL